MRHATAVRAVRVAGTLTVVGAAVVGAGTAAAVGPGPTSATVVRRASAAATRDPLQWPFARTSIWNTPIGTRARYVPARIRGTGFGVDVDWFVITRSTDRAVPVYAPAASGTDPCAGNPERQQAGRHPGPHAPRTQRVPRSLVVAGAAASGDEVGRAVSSAFLQPDRRTLVSYALTARCTPGGPLYGRWSGETSLYGDGIGGGYGESGLSSIGGSVRTGELTGAGPIRHALKLEVWGRYLFDDQATGGARWPASTAGAGATRHYQGSVAALRMGGLLALPPTASASRLGVRSAAGRTLLAALRDYGAYVVGDSGTDTVDLCVEHEAAADYARRTGHPLATDPGLRADMARMIGALAVVDDNAPTSIGGHGARRARWAPPFRAAGSPASSGSTAAGSGAAGAAAPRPARPAAPAPASVMRAGQVAEIDVHDGAPVLAVWAVAVGALCLLLLGLWAGRRAFGSVV